MTALLAAGAGLLLAASLWELAGARGERTGEALRRRTGLLLSRLPAPLAANAGSVQVSDRIRAAGLERRVEAVTLVPLRIVAALLAIPGALFIAQLAPGRTGILALAGIPVAALFGPDLVLARLAVRRRSRVAGSLPDALDLMAVGAVSGGGPRALLHAAAGGSAGPLREELTAATAELECGRSQRAVLEAVRAGPIPELASMATLLERSQRLGSPIADGLREQAGSLRADQTRALESRAARAAPKIQLVVALLLVPSVLLMIAAAILANSDRLLGGL